MAAPHISPARAVEAESYPAQRSEIGEHWTPDEIASFACHPGTGRVLTVRAGTQDGHNFEQVLKEAGYRIGRLPITRDASHLPHAAATFKPHVIYVTLAHPMSSCLDALELLGQDGRTRDVPLVALVGPAVKPTDIEEAYTRSGCDFLRTEATPIEYLARTHLLTRLSKSLRDGVIEETTRLHEPPRAGAANDDPRVPLSLLDADSGAHSARYLSQRLPAEIARATRYGRDLSVIVLDCTRAARSQGASARVTARLREHCRETDLIARADGQRFIVLLPETPMDGAKILAERVVEALGGDQLPADSQVLTADAPALARILSGS